MIKMMPGRVLIKQKKTKKVGNILLPATQYEFVGKVVSIGKELVVTSRKKIPPPVKVGTWVMFKETGDHKITIDNEDYLHITFDDIIIAIDE